MYKKKCTDLKLKSDFLIPFCHFIVIMYLKIKLIRSFEIFEN